MVPGQVAVTMAWWMGISWKRLEKGVTVAVTVTVQPREVAEEV